MFPIGTKLSSLRHKASGVVVGYGALQWPTEGDISGDGGVMQAVYLVQIARGSSSLGPACVVFRADQVEEA